MSPSFGLGVRAEFIAHHLHAIAQSKLPPAYFVKDAYNYIADNAPIVAEILEAYHDDIWKAVNRGYFSRADFTYRELPSERKRREEQSEPG